MIAGEDAFNDLPMESRPSQDQRERLLDFLVESMALARKYQMLIATVRDAELDVTIPAIVDLNAQTIVGIDLTYVQDPNSGRIRAYLPKDSVLDDVWIVEQDDGTFVEQRYWSGEPT